MAADDLISLSSRRAWPGAAPAVVPFVAIAIDATRAAAATDATLSLRRLNIG